MRFTGLFLLIGLGTALAQGPGSSRGPGFKRNPDVYTKKLAPFVASPQRIVDRMLEIASIKPNETVFDLGCGDGRILFQAAQKYQAKAVGIEIDEKLVQNTNDHIASLGLQNRVKVQQGNLMEADLSSADVVTIYLLTQSNELLRPRLERCSSLELASFPTITPCPAGSPKRSTAPTKATTADTSSTFTRCLLKSSDRAFPSSPRRS